MLSSGFERSMTRWKLEPKVSPRYSNTEPWPSMMFGRVELERRTWSTLGGAVRVERDQDHRRRTHAEQRRQADPSRWA